MTRRLNFERLRPKARVRKEAPRLNIARQNAILDMLEAKKAKRLEDERKQLSLLVEWNRLHGRPDDAPI